MEPICKLKDIYKALYIFEKDFSDKNAITINEAMVLCCLKDGKPKAANELCEFVGLSNSRVSRIITSVEDKGYIARQMGTVDKRQMIFTLTDLGIQKIQSMKSDTIDFSGLASQITKLLK